ncbi:MAG: hypothetical protein ABI625_05995 [bacterium]
MTNPFNPEAGSTAAPASARERELVERSADVIWRSFPYFAWRFSARGRSFGRSDAGYLVTLLALAESTSRAQVTWLAGVLAPRGMPSILLEYQLESLGRIWRQEGLDGSTRFLGHAAELRAARLSALDAQTFADCEHLCAVAARGDRKRRGAGMLIAAAVADGASGLGEYGDPLIKWFTDAATGDAAWSAACDSAGDLARRALRVQGQEAR